jgi:hypothetical protein
MARSYAQMSTSMWRNGDFLGLPSALQRVYMLLSTQSDVSAVGVLHLSVTRWAGRAPDTTVDDINRALDGLAERRFIVLDRGSEEVLLRAFLRWDNGYKNPKRLPAIRDAANEIESRTIVRALAVEFERVSVAARFRGQCVIDSETTSEAAEADSADDSAFPQVDSLSIGYSENGEGVSASERRVPQPPTRNPQPVPPSADSADAPSGQAALDGMPAPLVANETEEQTGWRLARAWEARRKADNKPIIVRGGKRKPDQVLMPLKNLIRGALVAGYNEAEVNATLERCAQGIPSATTFDKTIERIRDENAPGSSLAPYNPPHHGASPTYTTPAPRRSTAALRAEQGLSVADELDREYGHGRYAQEGAR